MFCPFLENREEEKMINKLVAKIKETKAPLGYELSTEVKEIVINDNLEGVGSVHSFKYLNTLLPVTITKTGDNQSLGLYAGLAAASILGLGYIILKRKRKEV